ncbi:MAG: MBL fold metallo-hydrolase [Nocardioidaceae bacterium]
MRVQFVGSGDAFGSGGRFQTCIWVQAGDFTVLVDCGASSLIAMRRLGLDPGEVDAVLLSHLHGDHFGGVPFLVLDAQFSRRVRPLTVAGPPGVEDRVVSCMENLFPGSSTARRRFETQFLEIPGDLTPVRVGPTTVSGAEVIHASGGPPLALRVEVDGKTLAYSGDTGWSDALVTVAREADLFVCEAYFYDKKIPYHLDYATLREHLPGLKARRVVLTHMSIDMLERLPLGVQAAHDGLALDV